LQVQRFRKFMSHAFVVIEKSRKRKQFNKCRFVS
jgi:hypothetical protein